jgi:hypothetical protein
VFSREVILNRVWGYDYLGDSNVIEVHISYPGEAGDPTAASWTARRGLLLGGERTCRGGLSGDAT